MAELIFKEAQYTRDEINRSAESLACKLLQKGIKEHDCVGMFLPNCPEFIIIYLASTWIGAVPVPISIDLNNKDLEVLFKRENFAVLFSNRHQIGQFPEGSLPNLTIEIDKDWLYYAGSDESKLLVKKTAPETRFFTSGSTSIPKTVIRKPLPDSLAELRDKRFVESWGMTTGMKTAVTGPLSHQAPLFHFMGALNFAEKMVILDAFDAKTILSAISTHKLTHLHLVPRLMGKIANLSDDELDSYDLTSLEFILHGAAVCPQHVKHRLLNKLNCEFREYYATSEFGMVSQIDTADWLERPSSVGKAFSGVDIEIRELESGQTCFPGTVGKVYFSSDDMPEFHYNVSEDESFQIHKKGDFVSTNDVGYMDEDGFLHLTGRTDDIALISGIKFSSQATLQSILRHELVDEAIVNIERDEERGDRFIAHVKLIDSQHNITSSGLRDYLLGELPKLAVPKEINFTSDLPIFDTGKSLVRYLDVKKSSDYQSHSRNVIRKIAKKRDDVFLQKSGFEVVHSVETGSTNTDALNFANSSCGPLTLFYTDQQTSGRGRQGRTWLSPAGNIYWTMLVDCTNDDPHDLGLVFATALAVRDTVQTVLSDRVRVETKWPNDTLIEGRKVSGILIETSNNEKLFRAVGVGINVENFPAIGMMYPATCLRAEGALASRDDILLLLTSNFINYLNVWREEGFEGLKPAYLSGAYKFGEKVPVRQDDGTIINGIYHDLTKHGIVLRLDSGEIKTFATGDLIRPPEN